MLGLPIDAITGATYVTGMAACRAALRDDRLTSDPHVAGLIDRPVHNLLLSDGAEHARVRRAVLPSLSAERLAAMQPVLLATNEAALTAILESERAELVSTLIEPLVARAACAVLGIDDDALDAFADLGHAMHGILEPDADDETAERCQAAGRTAAFRIERARRRDKTAGLIADLDAAAADGRIDPLAVSPTATIVFHGGHENPLNFLGHFAVRLLTNPPDASNEFDAVVEDAFLQITAARKVLRFARTDIPELGVERGAVVWVDLESANQELIDDPESLDARHRHLTFGLGAHHCPGRPLARQLAELMWSSVREVAATMDLIDVVPSRMFIGDGINKIVVERRSDPAGY